MRRDDLCIYVSPSSRARLKALIADRNTPSKVIWRAEIVVATADGCGSNAIMRRTGKSKPCVWRWQERYIAEGVEGLLRDKTRPSRKPPLPDKIKLAVLTKTANEMPANATHWSRAAMAAEMGISPSSVGRIWAEAGLKPHLVRRFKISNDPQFEEKVTDVVSLYLNPPDRALVLCVDEKSQIQALDRTQPGLEGGHDIPSQPTISRLENVADVKSLYRIGIGYIDFFCRSYATPPRCIELDIDDTDDLVHGGQQLALFNTHAGGHCFKPMHIFEAGSGKPVLSLLRPGKRPDGEEIARVLWHVIHRIRRHWPRVRILVRGDGHYCAPQVLDLLRRLDCNYILGLSINPKLDAIAKPWREQCENKLKPSRPKVRRFHQLTYQAGSWSHPETVIARVEATKLGSDARFVVTNLQGRGKVLYENIYCARGRTENLIKDLKLYTRSDKTACTRWEANQLRLFLHMGAYWLLHSVRLAAPRKSRWRGATFETIRNAFVKIGCRVEELRTRIKLSFTSHLPYGDDLAAITTRLTAQGP